MTPSTRYRRIVAFFAAVALRLIAWEWILPRIGFGALADRNRSERLRQIAISFRHLAVEMGGVLIKVGQFLSARVDVLPREITSELVGLQDEVPAEPFDAVRAVMERELGGRLSDKFASIDEMPLAAASLGQVHRATLLPAAAAPDAPPAEALRVVVKVQRPNIETLIATDLAALRAVGRWLHRWPPIRRRANIPSLLAEFTRVLYEELDYLAEGRNAETFAVNLAKRGGLRVPRVYWSHTTQRVLTLEDVFAIKITDYAAVEQAGIDRAAVAQRLFRAYLQQIFQDGFFHADPHPGNLFVEPHDGPDSWLLVFVDFGMVGRLSADVRAGLQEAAIAIGTRDARRFVRAQKQLGLLLPSANLELLERAQERIFDHLWGLSMGDLQKIGRVEMLEILKEFRELLYTMPFHVPEDLILLGRTFGILSGMCTGISPQFNMWHELAPFAKTLIGDESPFEWRRLLDGAWDILSALGALPRQAETTFEKLNRSELALRIPQVEQGLERMELTMRRLMGTLLAAAAVLGAVQLEVASQRSAAVVLAAAGAIALLWSATRRT